VLYIARLGPVRQGVLAEALGLEGPSLVRLLDQLCARGLVERRDDSSDGRAKILHLTQEGRALAGVVEPAVDAFRTQLVSEVSDDDLAAALRVFSAFERALDAARTQPKTAAP
jgi:MarR family transcriptional regulator for hemolysin